MHLSLRRDNQERAIVFWDQAREFSEATALLSPLAAPVPAYYCMLNAVKTLLTVRGIAFRHIHGVKGTPEKGRTSLDGERIELLDSGVIPALCGLLGESSAGESFSLKTALYNLAWIHRAYCLTYTTTPELFIPIQSPQFVTRDGSADAWVIAKVEEKHATGHTTRQLPGGYKRTDEADEVFRESKPYVIRRTETFQWLYGKSHEAGNLERLIAYHREVRRRLMYIRGPQRLWYLKRFGGSLDAIAHSSLTLTIAGMHRVSEMARYDPLRLYKHLEERHHNWLLTEFIETAPRQFIDQVASELTRLCRPIFVFQAP